MVAKENKCRQIAHLQPTRASSPNRHIYNGKDLSIIYCKGQIRLKFEHFSEIQQLKRNPKNWIQALLITKNLSKTKCTYACLHNRATESKLQVKTRELNIHSAICLTTTKILSFAKQCETKRPLLKHT